MKKQIIYIAALLVLTLSSCERYYNPGLNVHSIVVDTTHSENEFDVLMRFIPNAGDYINSKGVPNMVSAENVEEHLSHYLVIDIRSNEEYVAGHINGAVNVRSTEIIDYLEQNVAASTYDKMVIACHSGQSASYITGVLRMIGYNNIYAMKYGMGAWNRSLDKWSPNISNKYAGQLETTPNPKAEKSAYPVLETGQTCGAEILEFRAKTVLETPFKRLKISAERAFSDTSFYIMNYWPKSKYEKGHIPGSVQYTPKKDLKAKTFLSTIPSNKKILVYCYTGQNAAFTVAYLRMLGYNAFTLGFGANSFMHSTLISRSGWHGFKAEDKLNDFPLVKGRNPTNKDFEKKFEQTKNTATKKKIVKRKKKEVEGGCG